MNLIAAPISTRIYQQTMKLMGNRFEISVVSDEEGWAMQRINEAVDEIKRIEKLLNEILDELRQMRAERGGNVSAPAVRDVPNGNENARPPRPNQP